MERKARQRQVCLGWVASFKHRSIALKSDCPSRESHQDRIVSCDVMLPAFVPLRFPGPGRLSRSLNSCSAAKIPTWLPPTPPRGSRTPYPRRPLAPLSDVLLIILATLSLGVVEPVIVR